MSVEKGVVKEYYPTSVRLPVDLLRRVDATVKKYSFVFNSRAEFIRRAIEFYLLHGEYKQFNSER